MLRVGRQLGQRFGVNQYYEIHGCADPTTLFSGRQKIMATLAMAQGCQSFQAMRVCKMAQVSGFSLCAVILLTVRDLPGVSLHSAAGILCFQVVDVLLGVGDRSVGVGCFLGFFGTIHSRICLDSQSISQPADESAGQSVSQRTSQLISRSVREPAN